jgi:5-methylcytosine-specific restriction protein B
MGVSVDLRKAAEQLDEVISRCLMNDKQNAQRLRDVDRFVGSLIGSATDQVYAIEVSKPGNLGKQLEQSKRARNATLAIAILDEDGGYVPPDYESAASTLVSSPDVAVTCIALVARELDSWRVSLIVSSDRSEEARALSAVAPQARTVMAGEKPPLRFPIERDNAATWVAPQRLLDDRLRQILLRIHTEMSVAGELKDAATIDRYFSSFRDRFGPEKLSTLDGEVLLDTMHSHLNRQSLVYWIEFKNDSEFPAIFGSIAGGSAGKFGIYRRKENGAWARQGKDRNPEEVSLAEAIDVARAHRDQLIRGAQLLEGLPAFASQADYVKLEEQLTAIAPDVADTAWGHKYFHLLFPDKLDDFHVARYQHYHLLRLLQPEPITEGRYSSAWRYVAIAHELGVSLNHLTSILNRRHGPPRGYWRVGTHDGKTLYDHWDSMRDTSTVAIGWSLLGNIGPLREAERPRDEIKRLLNESYPNTPTVTSRKAGEIVAFLKKMTDGDVVCASAGSTVRGVGIVRGPYAHAAGTDFPHRRPVEWATLKPWQLATAEGNQTTVWEFKEYASRLQIERVLLDATSEGSPQQYSKGEATAPRIGEGTVTRGPAPPLSGIPRRIEDILDRKGQVILYGPPGTGKTFFALETARELVARRAFGRVFADLTEAERTSIEGSEDAPGLVRTSTFHPEYGYEGFIEGYRPILEEGRLAYELRDGVFKRLCDDARRDPVGKPHVMVVDEINRGDIPRIFGELLTLLERDKRGRAVRLPLSGKSFSVPRNVFVIGTMNTADRSIALLDVALRRRFGFIALMPDYAMLGKTVIAGLPLSRWLTWVNARVRQVAGADGRHREIGHGYFWSNGAPVSDAAVLSAILRDDVVPLLEEYCFEDLGQLAPILGEVVVDLEAQRVRYEVFDGDPEAAISALLEAVPEIQEDALLGSEESDSSSPVAESEAGVEFEDE